MHFVSQIIFDFSKMKKMKKKGLDILFQSFLGRKKIQVRYKGYIFWNTTNTSFGTKPKGFQGSRYRHGQCHERDIYHQQQTLIKPTTQTMTILCRINVVNVIKIEIEIGNTKPQTSLLQDYHSPAG